MRYVAVAAVLLADEQHRHVQPGVLRHEQPGGDQPGRPAQIVSGPRYNGILLPGDGFPSDASDLAVYNDPAVLALFQGAPRGLTETHKNVFEPRGGCPYSLNDKTIVKASAGIFHNRVTLNDSLLLGGNPPFQPQVGVSNGSVDNPARPGGAAALPFGMTAIDPVFKHPTAIPVVGRRAA